MRTKTRRNTKRGEIATVANSTPKVENLSRVINLHQKCIPQCEGGLADFLRDHQGEWYSPHEIHQMGGGDIRTVKKRIDYLANTSHLTTDTGYRIEIARRGGRIYCVRFVRVAKNSIDTIKARIAEEEKAKTRKAVEQKRSAGRND